MICLPRGSMLKHGVEDDQEFAHAGHEGDFLGFVCGHQPLVEFTRHRIPPDRYHGGHVESCSHVSPATPNHPEPGQRPLSRFRGATPTRALHP